MRIKLDENLSRHLKAALAEAGHQASTAADENLLGKTDAEVAAAAKSGNMIVFYIGCSLCGHKALSARHSSRNCIIPAG